MRSLILSSLLISTAIVSGPLDIAKDVVDGILNQCYGYKPLSVTAYPQAVHYFDQLHLKYSTELENINLAIGEFKWFFTPLWYSLKTIYIPEKWIQQLQMQDQYYQDLVEWHVLRQAGFMNNNHVLKAIAVNTVAFYLKAYAEHRTMTRNKYGEYVFLPLNPTYKQEIASAMSLGLSLYAIYQFFAREYIADAYACQICTNPRALQAGYDYIDRTQARGIIPAIFQSCASWRMENIQKAYVKKFGKIMPILVADQVLF